MNKLVEKLIADGVLKTPEIIAAFLKNDRKFFVTAELTSEAYVDAPLPIGQGQTISQPYTVAFMIELLEPLRGQKILDIGFGSGWTTAILASIVGKEGRVYGLEIVPEVYEFGRANLERHFGNQPSVSPHSHSLSEIALPFSLPRPGEGAPSSSRGGRGQTVAPSSGPAWAGPPSPARGEGNNVKSRGEGRGEVGSGAVRMTKINNIALFNESGWEGLPEEAPFDRILASAAAPEIPLALKGQLVAGGKMVLPVGPGFASSIKLLEKIDEKKFKEQDYPGFAFVPFVK